MLNNIFSYTLPFFCLIGILVAIHEGGHFFAARIQGIKVTDFAVGMGPTLLRWQDRSGCVWRLCLFPIGGYVKMLGDENIASSSAVQTEMDPEIRKQLFHLRPIWQRAIVIFAGPAINFIFGFLLIGCIYMFIGRSMTPPVVENVMPGYPAAQAGLQKGDRILMADGHKIKRFEDLSKYVALKPGHEISFKIARGEQTLNFMIAPAAYSQETIVGKREVGKIGITSTNNIVVEKIGPVSAFAEGLKDVWQMTLATYQGIWETLTLSRPLKDMGGPVKIAEVSGNVWINYGLLAFLTLMAAISVNLAIVNLLPFPVLDGGHLLLYAIEALQGRPVSERVTGYLFKGSAVFLLAFLMIITYSDISGIVQKIWVN